MGIVYVVQQPTRRVTENDVERFPWRYKSNQIGTFVPSVDLTPAMRYGDIVLLLDTAVQVGIAIKPMIRQFRDKLRTFSDDDFLITTGDPAAMVLAFTIAQEYNSGRVNLLRWDRREKGYIKLAIEL